MADDMDRKLKLAALKWAYERQEGLRNNELSPEGAKVTKTKFVDKLTPAAEPEPEYEQKKFQAIMELLNGQDKNIKPAAANSEGVTWTDQEEDEEDPKTKAKKKLVQSHGRSLTSDPES